MLAPPPEEMLTLHASVVGLWTFDDADQYTVPIGSSVKGWPVGKAGVLWVGSSRLINSTTDGSRQPLLAPTALLIQESLAAPQPKGMGKGDCSHTSCVSLSKTAAPPNSVSTLKRWVAVGILSSQLSNGTAPVEGANNNSAATVMLCFCYGYSSVPSFGQITQLSKCQY